MNKSFLVSISLLLYVFMSNAGAQENRFFMPSEISSAYAKGTRSFDGRPGDKYWQNTADYKIDVRMHVAERLIDGVEEVVELQLTDQEKELFQKSVNNVKELITKI